MQSVTGYQRLFGTGAGARARMEDLSRVRVQMMGVKVEYELLQYAERRRDGDLRRCVSIPATADLTKEERDSVLFPYVSGPDPWPWVSWVWGPTSHVDSLMFALEHPDGVEQSLRFWSLLQQGDGELPKHDGCGFYKVLSTSLSATVEQCRDAGVELMERCTVGDNPPRYHYRIPAR